VIDSREGRAGVASCEAFNPSSNACPRLCLDLNSAYVLYTSGSTGVPKAVVGLHQGLAKRLCWFRDCFPFANSLTILARSSPGFIDASTEILGALIHGGHVVLAPPAEGGDPLAIARLISQHGIGMITLTPSLLIQLLTPELGDRLSRCNFWISSGECLPETTIARFIEMLPDARLINLYGCSEASGDSLCNDHDLRLRSIGTPIWGTSVYVLDEHLQIVSPGSVGELYIAGAGLARGYMNRSSTTAERFVPDPLESNGNRMYRTGDLAVRRADGTIEFVGRYDHQVKIRGIRLELGEVEMAIRRYLEVEDTVVVARTDPHGDTQLVAYVTAPIGVKSQGNEMRRVLQAHIPSHMIPISIVVLDSIPYTTNGKVDRQALPEQSSEPRLEVVTPSSAEEQVLCRIFADTLGIDGISVDANLFDLGAHSLIATRIASRIRTELKVDCTVAKLFEAKNISRLAEMLRTGGEVTRPMIKPR
jgi:amino acid adenylation domain-containing protein